MTTDAPLSTGHLRALRYLADGEWHSSSFDVGYYSPGHRAQINILQSLVKRGFATQRHCGYEMFLGKSRHRSAAWRITEAGRIAHDLEEKRIAALKVEA